MLHKTKLAVGFLSSRADKRVMKGQKGDSRDVDIPIYPASLERYVKGRGETCI